MLSSIFFNIRKNYNFKKNNKFFLIKCHQKFTSLSGNSKILQNNVQKPSKELGISYDPVR
jgi:hypothetical protein